MRYKRQCRAIQKRSFLLFELILSLSLVLLCLLPLINIHIGIAKSELGHIREVREEQIAQKAFCLLKIDIYEHKYSWADLSRGIQNEEYTITKVDQSTKDSNDSGLVLQALIPVGKNVYKRFFYVEKTSILPN